MQAILCETEEFMRRSLAAILVALAIAAPAAARSASTCTALQADHAAAIVYDIDEWGKLYRFFNKYGTCEVGNAYIVDGLSDRVADMLVSHWDSIDVLIDAVKLHPPFLPFVLSHIDRVMTESQARVLLDNVRQHCPADGAQLCGLIERRVLHYYPE